MVLRKVGCDLVKMLSTVLPGMAVHLVANNSIFLIMARIISTLS